MDKKCETCSEWESLGTANTWGRCKLFEQNPEGDFQNIYVSDCDRDALEHKIAIETSYHFGCMLWESKS